MKKTKSKDKVLITLEMRF